MPTTWVSWRIVEDGESAGYNVLVGGGLGTTPSAQKTFPFLAVPLCYVDRDSGAARSARRSSRSFAISATGPTASERGSSTSFTTGGCPPFARRSRNTWARPLADPETGAGSAKSTIISAGTSRVTASFSWAFPSRTAGSATSPAIGWRAACVRFFEKYRDAGAIDLPAIDLAGGHRAELARATSRAGSNRTGSPRSNRSRRCAAGRWPALPCRPAAWP